MKNQNITRYILLHLLLLSAFSSYSQILEYPAARQEIVHDTFFSQVVTDKYRYMEQKSEELQQWLNEEKKLSRKYLRQYSVRHNVKSKLEKYSDNQYNIPRKDGRYYFSYAYYSGVSVPALFMKHDINDNPQLIVDPNYLGTDEGIILRGYKVSGDSKYLAYIYSREGRDQSEIQIVNLRTGHNLKDHLVDVKFSDLAWKDDGFFYTRYSDSGVDETGSICYHRLKTRQEEDKVIFSRNNPLSTYGFNITHNERYLTIHEEDNHSGLIHIYYVDLDSEEPAPQLLLRNMNATIEIKDVHDGMFIAASYVGAKTGSVIAVDPNNGQNWKVIIPPYSNAVLTSAKCYKNEIIATYQTNLRPIVAMHNYKGDLLHMIQDIPTGYSIHGFEGEYEDRELLYYLTSFAVPPVVYHFNLDTFKEEIKSYTKVKFDAKDFEYENIEYTSKDGTEVPMLIMYKKGLKKKSNNPCLLRAYGGFGAIVSPSFDANVVNFLMEGGIFAFANVRGGGDKGTEWSSMGRGLNKQNSIDDFIAAAEYLIEEKFTSSDKLAIEGSSNGGMLVAAAAIQRPDLFKAVIARAGVYDMLRYERFTVGKYHRDEYGSINNSLGFFNLLSYSPLHNIKEDVDYPAMLILASESDERVPPHHSYKLAAALQNRKIQENPVLLRVEEKAGHSGASYLYGELDEMSEVQGFVMEMLGF